MTDTDSGSEGDADDDRRVFYLRAGDGSRLARFSSRSPRRAALKAARRLPEEHIAEDEDDAEQHLIQLREKGTAKEHVYWAWAWYEERPEDAPDHLGERVTRGNVSKEGIRDLPPEEV